MYSDERSRPTRPSGSSSLDESLQPLDVAAQLSGPVALLLDLLRGCLREKVLVGKLGLDPVEVLLKRRLALLHHRRVRACDGGGHDAPRGGPPLPAPRQAVAYDDLAP